MAVTTIEVVSSTIRVLQATQDFIMLDDSDAIVVAFAKDVGSLKRAMERIVKHDEKHPGSVQISDKLQIEIEKVSNGLKEEKPIKCRGVFKSPNGHLVDRFNAYDKKINKKDSGRYAVAAASVAVDDGMSPWLIGPFKAKREAEWREVQTEMRAMMSRVPALKARLDKEVLSVLCVGQQ